MLSIVRRYRFKITHTLKGGVPERYRERHDHDYVMLLTVGGHLDEDGLIIEYDSLDKVVLPVIRLVADRDLNTLSERCSTREAAAVSANPTVERLTLWAVARLEGIVASAVNGRRLELQGVRIDEDHDAYAEWSMFRGFISSATRAAYEAGLEAGQASVAPHPQDATIPSPSDHRPADAKPGAPKGERT